MLALLATAASDCGRANRTWCSACSVSFSAYGDTGSGPFGVVGAGTFIYDLAAGRFRYDTWSGDQNISAIFVCNPPVPARALPNFTCATYTVDWKASSCVAAPTPMAIPLFALPGDASLTQSSKTENVELWSAKVTGASRVDYTVDSQVEIQTYATNDITGPFGTRTPYNRSDTGGEGPRANPIFVARGGPGRRCSLPTLYTFTGSSF